MQIQQPCHLRDPRESVQGSGLVYATALRWLLGCSIILGSSRSNGIAFVMPDWSDQLHVKFNQICWQLQISPTSLTKCCARQPWSPATTKRTATRHALVLLKGATSAQRTHMFSRHVGHLGALINERPSCAQQNFILQQCVDRFLLRR